MVQHCPRNRLPRKQADHAPVAATTCQTQLAAAKRADGAHAGELARACTRIQPRASIAAVTSARALVPLTAIADRSLNAFA